MSQSTSGEGTKIAQAAKDLNVTSVTIRRYLSEFNIDTTSDENGVKVLPPRSIEELKEVRRLKEEGLTNPKVMEFLEDLRSQEPASKPKAKGRSTKVVTRTVEVDEEEEESTASEPAAAKPRARSQAATKTKAAAVEKEELESAIEAETSEAEADLSAPSRSKHTLTCQTCAKTFEHMNPRLRDCLDCYRTKRKERRRGGGAERTKHVIQHPIAQQVTTKNVQQLQPTTLAVSALPTTPKVSTVRNYRKAIEDTRHITANLKRRLERPDLLEGERRWLEQIYAYQLILHQGWRHLSDYKSQTRAERGERTERGERGERHERGDRHERGERTERGERHDRGERAERTEQTEQTPNVELTDSLD